ncbi:unnamed protein product, partial [marine sediment metagenome]
FALLIEFLQLFGSFVNLDSTFNLDHAKSLCQVPSVCQRRIEAKNRCASQFIKPSFSD